MPDPANRFLVAPASSGGPDGRHLLERVQAFVATNPAATIMPGRSAASGDHLVVAMDDETLRRMRSHFGDELIIEPDAPLRF